MRDAGPLSSGREPRAEFFVLAAGFLLLAAVDWAVYFAFATRQGGLSAQLLGFAAAAIATAAFSFNPWLNPFGQVVARHGWRLYARFASLALLLMFLKGGVLSILLKQLHWSYSDAAPWAALASSAGLCLLGSFGQRPLSWRFWVLIFTAYMVLLRFLYGGSFSLFHQESYYWDYSQHLNISYLDHPPLISWLIRAATELYGNNEFALRMVPWTLWPITAGFIFCLTRNLFDRPTAQLSVMLLAVLPVMYVSSSFAVPDAPLFMCWAGVLFFIERALIRQSPRAWYGVGLFLGLGMLSKYAILLLASAIFLLLIFHRPWRFWLRRPEPYLALLIGLLLFSPVLIWNYQHDWASYSFQVTQRVTHSFNPRIHVLIADILIRLSPLGVLALCCEWRPLRKARAALAGMEASAASPELKRKQQRLLFQGVTLIPVAFLLTLSLGMAIKMNWLSPAFLGTLPFIAAHILKDHGKYSVQRLWKPMILGFLMTYGFALHYASIGWPGIEYRQSSARPFAFSELTKELIEVERDWAQSLENSGRRPAIAGIDRYVMASQISFYLRKLTPANEAVPEVNSQNLFGRQGLMYSFWEPRQSWIGRNLIVVGYRPEDLSDEKIAPWFERVAEIKSRSLFKNGMPAGHVYYRFGYSYTSEPKSE